MVQNDFQNTIHFYKFWAFWTCGEPAVLVRECIRGSYLRLYPLEEVLCLCHSRSRTMQRSPAAIVAILSVRSMNTCLEMSGVAPCDGTHVRLLVHCWPKTSMCICLSTKYYSYPRIWFLHFLPYRTLVSIKEVNSRICVFKPMHVCTR